MEVHELIIVRDHNFLRKYPPKITKPHNYCAIAPSLDTKTGTERLRK